MSMELKAYEVTFSTKKGGIKHWVIDVEAFNLKEARAKAEDLWEENESYNKMHQFGINVRKLKPTEEYLYHYFKRI